MSGHSHSKKIKHAKELTDQKKGQMFSKMARAVSVAVKQGGSNPEINSKLKVIIETARSLNMPRENIERAIKQATGGIEGANLEEVLFEAYGPGGTTIIIEGITDNKNRTLGEIKQILGQHGGKLVGEGSVKWMFERKGCIIIDTQSQMPDVNSKENLELSSIEAGADDIYWQENILNIYTKPESLEEVKKNLEAKNIKIDSASLDWVAKEEISADEKTKEACQKLFEALDENEAVQEIYSNLKI